MACVCKPHHVATRTDPTPAHVCAHSTCIVTHTAHFNNMRTHAHRHTPYTDHTCTHTPTHLAGCFPHAPGWEPGFGGFLVLSWGPFFLSCAPSEDPGCHKYTAWKKELWSPALACGVLCVTESPIPRQPVLLRFGASEAGRGGAGCAGADVGLSALPDRLVSPRPQ